MTADRLRCGLPTGLACIANFVRHAAAAALLVWAVVPTELVRGQTDDSSSSDQATPTAEGQIPNQSYPLDEVFTKISPQLGDRHHNQPTVINGYLLLAGNGVHEFWDISDPYSPVLLSEMFSPHRFGDAESHQVSYAKFPDGSLYLVTVSGRGIDLWGIDDVRQPQLLSALELPGINYGDVHRGIWGVFWQGDYIYVGATSHGVYIVDATDPTQPKLVASVPPPEMGSVAPGTLFALGNLLVITTTKKGGAGVVTMDIGDPDQPTLLDFVRPPTGSYIGGFYGKNAHLLNPFRTYDVTTDPSNIRRIGLYKTPASEYMSFGDGHLFLGGLRGGSQGIWKYLITDPDDLRRVGRIPGRDRRWDDQFSVPIGNLIAISDDENVNGFVGSYLAVHDRNPDTRPPVVEYVNPPDGAADQATSSRIALSFSDQIELASVDGTTLVVRPVGGQALTGKWGYSQTVVTFWPDQLLEADTTYEIVAVAGGITDLVGNAIASEFRSVFRTGTPSPRGLGGIGSLTPVETDRDARFLVDPVSGSHEYIWDFGDGHEGAGTSASHRYDTPGRYAVTLSVVDPDGLDHFEAEAASLSGGVVATDARFPGYTGTGFANFPDDATGPDVKVRWQIARDSAGDADIHVRYAHKPRPKELELVVNGRTVTTVSLPSTGAWWNWRSVKIEDVALRAGDNTVDLVALNRVGPSIDRLSLSPESPVVVATYSATQVVHRPPTENEPAHSSTVIVAADGARAWAVNPDAATVTAVSTGTLDKAFESRVGLTPRSLAQAPDGTIWVVNEGSYDVSILDSSNGAVIDTIDLPYASMPYGIAFAPDGSAAYITLQALGQLLRIDPVSRTIVHSLAMGPDPSGMVPTLRGIAITSDSRRILVTRFVSPGNGGEIYDLAVQGQTVRLVRTIALANDPGPDSREGGRGVPNYISSVAISPDGVHARVPWKKDNIERGVFRDGQALTHDNTVRTGISQVELSSGQENSAARVDFDDDDMAFAAAFSPLGDLVFVAIQGSNSVNILDAYGGNEIAGVGTGLAPQGLVLDDQGRLYVQNFMSRSLSVFDVTDLLAGTKTSAGLLAEISLVGHETLPDEVLLGKQIFYNAASDRMSLEGYMSCASCHLDGGHDGRTWDFTDRGEGLRNTTSLRGRGGTLLHGPVHWTGNFDEIQDFENNIRSHFGGTGFMTDDDFNHGTRSDPLGDPKAGLSAELDALTAYVSSLTSVPPSPYRNADGSLTEEGERGKVVFVNEGCHTCHNGPGFTDSALGALHDVGTIRAASGGRLGRSLSGFDTPTLKGVWATAPYLHDGSAPTLAQAINAHSGISLSGSALGDLISYLQQLDELAVAPLDATLRGLVLSELDIGTFDPATTVYEATAAESVAGTTVTATPNSIGASVMIESADGSTSGPTRDVALGYGKNTITVTVTAPDGLTTLAYTVTVTRAPRPEVSIAAVSSPVAEGEAVEFEVTLSEAALEALTVAVSVTETGSMLSGAPPASMIVPQGATSATLGVPTALDAVAEADNTVIASLIAGDGYVLGAVTSASITVEDTPPPAGTFPRPNIVVILSDDMGWGQPGFNGGTEVETPSLDRIANEGVKLTQFYVVPSCSPTRASLLSGRHYWKTGAKDQRPTGDTTVGMLPDERTMAEALRDAGYATWMVGKWHLGQWETEHLPLQRGFDHHYGFYSGTTGYYSHKVRNKLSWHRNGRPVVEDGYATFLLAEEAVQLIERHDGSNPFLLYLAFNAPHLPKGVPPEYEALYAHLPNPDQRGQVKAMDDAIGWVIDALDRRDMLEDTLVVFFNDNGGRSRAGFNLPYRGEKGEFLKGGIRVPAAMRWPGNIAGGSETDALLQVVDLFPTFAGLAGAEPERELALDGRDAWQAISAGAASPRAELAHSLKVMRMGDWKLIEEDGLRWSGSTSPLQLYNISEDPYETTNLASSETAKVTELQERLVYHRQFTRGQAPASEIPTSAVVYGKAENAAYGAAVQRALQEQQAGNLGPTLVRMEAAAGKVKLVYDEALDTSSVPAVDAFTVVVNPGYTPVGVTDVEVSGMEVLLGLDDSPTLDQAVGLTYEVPDSGAIRDVDRLDSVGVTWVTAPVSAAFLEQDATLSALSLSGIDIGTFSAATTEYAVTVPNATSSTTVTATANGAGASVSISPGSTVSLAEGANEITVTVTAADATTVLTYTVVVTRAPLPLVSIAAVSSPVTEGEAVEFEVTLSEAALEALAVAVSVTETGSMLAGAPPASVIVPQGATSATLGVPTALDTVVEADSVVTASVAAGTGYTVGTESSATVRVEDDDEPAFTVAAEPLTIKEGASATLTVEITSGVTFGEDQPVDLSGTGTASRADYSLTPSSLTLSAGASSATAVLKALDDQEEEADETVTVAASYRGIALGSATVTIESVSHDATLSALSLSGVDIGTFASGTTAYTASVPSATTSTTVTAAANHTGASVSISPGAKVSLSEGANEITVTVTAEDGTTKKTYTVTVTRLSLPVVSIAAGTSPVTEGTAASFTVTLDQAAPEVLTVAVSVAESGSVLSGTPPAAVTFAKGQTSATLSVATAGDAVVEADSVVTASLTAGDGYAVGSGSSATVRVEDDDEAAFTVSAAPLTIEEGESATLTVEITSGVTFGEDQPVDLSVTGTASSADYSLTPSSLTLAAGASSVSVVLAALDDQEEEADETVTVAASHRGIALGSATVTIASVSHDATLSALGLSGIDIGTFASGTTAYTASVPSATTSATVTAAASHAEATVSISPGAEVSLAAGENIITVTVTAEDGTTKKTYTVTVTRLSLPVVSIAAGTTPVTEGTAASFTVTLDQAPPEALTVVVSVAESGSVLSGTPPAAVTFAKGQTSAALSVATAGDAVVEADSVVTASVTAGTGYTVGTESSATVRVEDDDEAAFEVTAAVGVLKEGQSTTLTVAITNGVTFAEEQTVDLSVAGTASAADYSLTPSSLAVAAGASEGTVVLAALDDREEEEEETVAVTASHGGTAIGTMTVTIESVSADATLSALSLSGVDIGMFASGTTSYTASVPYATASTTVTAMANHAGATVSISPGAEVSLAEGANEITVTVTAEDGTTKKTYTVTVTRAGLPVVSIVAMAATVSEEEPAAFRVSRTGPTTEVLAVQVTTTSSRQRAGRSRAVRVLPGQGSRETWTLRSDDTVVRENVTITKTLEPGEGYTIAPEAASATVVVEENDVAEFAMAVDPDGIDEGESATLTVGISNGVTFEEDQTIALAGSGTASASDYALSPLALTLVAGTSSGTVSLAASEDREEESDETVTLTASHEGVEVGSATVTIVSLSKDASLSSLSLSGVDIGTFSAETTAYAASVASSVETTTVTATASHAEASVAIAPGPEVSLAEGGNTVTVTVTAEDGKTARTYTVTVTRASLPVVSIAAVASRVSEGERAVFRASLTEPAAETLRVGIRWTRSDQSQSITQQLVFLAGMSSKTPSFSKSDDKVVREDLTVTITLQDGAGYRVSEDARSAQVVLEENDAAEFALAVDPASVAEGETAQVQVRITNGVTFAAGQTIALGFVGGTAAKGTDYTVSAESLTLRAGRRRVTASVTAIADSEQEDAETVTVEASHGGEVIGTATLTITGSDSKPEASGKGFSLAPENGSPSGIWSDGETAWVADLADARLYAYRREDGERQPQKDIATEPSPMGLWSDGETLWVAQLGGGLQAHRLSDGARLAGLDLALEQNAAPTGVWSDGETAWVAEWLGDAVHAYQLSDGQRKPGRDIQLAAGNLMPAGLWSDGQTLWVTDWRERVYAYRLADGSRDGRRDIEVSAGDTDPTGLWSSGEVLLATGWESGEVRAYRLPEVAESTPAMKRSGGPVARAVSLPAIVDPALRVAVGAALSKAPGEAVSPQDLAGLEELTARNAGIRDLSGLEQAHSLKELDLGFNPLADLRPLADLPALESLNLDGAVTDLQALVPLARLQRLSLRSNGIEDLWPLAGLVALSELDLGDNRIADLQPLAGMGSLAVLRADRNRIADLWPLASLAGLEALDLGANRVQDLQPLAGMGRLEALRIAGNRLTELHPLSGMKALADLGLAGNAVTELGALSDLTGLLRLDLRGNPLGDLRPLRALPSLVWVHVGGSRIDDLTPLDGLDGLTVAGRNDLEAPSRGEARAQ